MRTAFFAFVSLLAGSAYADLLAPIRVVDEDIPYAAPTLADVDGDGIVDLLVGQYRDDPYRQARVRLYRNSGSNERPHFESSAWLKSSAGQDVCTDEFCHTGAGPKLVDFNKDGIKDIACGAHDCRLTLFLGTKDQSFSPPEIKQYVDKDSDVYHKIRYNSRLEFHDWDSDGELDLLATTRSAIWLIRGDSHQPTKFAKPHILFERELLQEHFSCCTVADWNHDGRFDLVIGDWDGSVHWLRNDSLDEKAPSFADPVELISGHETATIPVDADGLYDRPMHPSGPLRVDVVDFNRDGKLDLLVGDAYRTSSDANKDAPDVVMDITAKRQRAHQRAKDLGRLLDIFQTQPGQETADEKRDRLEKLEIVRSECISTWQTRFPNSIGTRHGSVWLYLRTAD